MRRTLHPCPGCGRSCLGREDDPRCYTCRPKPAPAPKAPVSKATPAPRPAPPPRQRRACLRCDKPFRSEGRDNRLCRQCQQALAIGPSPAHEYRLRTRKAR